MDVCTEKLAHWFGEWLNVGSCDWYSGVHIDINKFLIFVNVYIKYALFYWLQERRESTCMPKQRPHMLLCKCVMKLWIFVHAVIDHIINFCFLFFYDDTKRTQIPTVKESFLMESAVSLAERIRNKEVQQTYLH